MKNFKVALQLYSIRDKMAEDMDKALEAVKKAGYDYVEFAGYFDKSAQEVKALLDKHGLTCVSVHQGYEVFLDEPEKNVEYLKTIGAKYCAVPWMGKDKHKGTEVFDKTVEDFKKVAKLLKDNGIQMLYHNHDFEFVKFEDKFLNDWLMEAVPEIQPQIDTCWVHYAGYNPSEYIAKYAGRLDVLHLKDFACKNLGGGPVYALIDSEGKEIKKDSKEENGFEFRALGSGIQNFGEILAAAEKAGTEIVVVEQDSWYDGDSLEIAAKSRAYLKTLGL
ncbi:MAG: sugar phosphate isomerase/epimerase [Clostridia bacterium]|nr:sugar phosphate isomerase/epimerase [Clostridia bacterium]